MLNNLDYRDIVIDSLIWNDGINSLDGLYKTVRGITEDGSCDQDAVDATLSGMVERKEIHLVEIVEGSVFRGGILKLYELPTLDDYDYNEDDWEESCDD